MDESFGARMRRQRECLGIPLTTIAEQTKIKLVLLEALERGDVSRWPSGIFRRSFIRSYARAIGLDPDSLVREFLERYPDPIEQVAQLPAAADAAGPPPSILQHLVDVARSSLSSLRQGASRRRGPVSGDAGDGPPSSSAIASRAAPQRAEKNPAKAPAGTVQPRPPFGSTGDPKPAMRTGLVEGVPAAAGTGVAPAVVADAGRQPLDGASGSADPVAPDAGTGDSANGASATAAAQTTGAALPPASPIPPVRPVDLTPLAQLCTGLGQAIDLYDAAAMLEQAAGVLDSKGLIVWAWDPDTAELTPALVHGYSNRTLAHLPRVRPEDENATAAAFRSGQISVVSACGQASGALVVPLLAPSGRVGVLACELKTERVHDDAVPALATIVAAQLARLVEAIQPAEAADRMLA
jgi:hypothetical protein